MFIVFYKAIKIMVHFSHILVGFLLFCAIIKVQELFKIDPNLMDPKFLTHFGVYFMNGV